MLVLEGIIPTGPIAMAVIKTLSVRITGAAALRVNCIFSCPRGLRSHMPSHMKSSDGFSYMICPLNYTGYLKLIKAVGLLTDPSYPMVASPAFKKSLPSKRGGVLGILGIT
jgi:hypothetical protein